MPTPRCAPIAGRVSHWSTEEKMVRTYRTLLFAADLDQLITDTLGAKHTLSQIEAADERLEHVMPELIRKLRPKQQAPVAELLLGESPDLVAAIRLLIKLERNLTHRDDDPRLLLNDDARLKAAGMGRLTQANYRKVHDPANPSARWLSKQKLAPPTPPVAPLNPPLVLTPWPPVAVKFRSTRRSPRKSAPVLRGQLALPFPGGGVTVAAL